MGDSFETNGWHLQTDAEFDAWESEMLNIVSNRSVKSDRPPAPKGQKTTITMTKEQPLTSDIVIDSLIQRYNNRKVVETKPTKKKRKTILELFKIKNLFNFLLSIFISISVIFLIIFYLSV